MASDIENEENDELEKLYIVVEIKDGKRQIATIESNEKRVAAVTGNAAIARKMIMKFVEASEKGGRVFRLVEYVKVVDLMDLRNHGPKPKDEK